MVGELVAQGALDLTGKQCAIVAEVPFQRVLVDDDAVLVTFASDAVAVVHAVGVVLGAEVGDDDRDLLQHLLELLRQGVDRVGDEGFELVEVRGVGHAINRRGSRHDSSRLRDDVVVYRDVDDFGVRKRRDLLLAHESDLGRPPSVAYSSRRYHAGSPGALLTCAPGRLSPTLTRLRATQNPWLREAQDPLTTTDKTSMHPFWEIGFFNVLLVFSISWCLIMPMMMLAHELGHAAVALKVTPGPVVAYVGRPSCAIEVHFERLKIGLSPVPVDGGSYGARCTAHTNSATQRDLLAIALAGPLATALTIAILVWAAIATKGLPIWIPAALWFNAAFAFIALLAALNPRSSKSPRPSGAAGSDGAQALRAYRALRSATMP